MGQRLSRGILSQFIGAGSPRKPSPADSQQEPGGAGTRATQSPPQQVTSAQERRKGVNAPGGAQDSPSPVPAKRWCSPPPAAERWVSEDGIPFHVHQADGIRICDGFLLGHCPHRELCPLHHTRYPFHWQLRHGGQAAWRSLSDSSQRHLEKLYSNAQTSLVRFSDRNGAFGLLDLGTMELSYAGLVSRVRRLGSTTDWKQNPRFHTRWEVYWKGGDSWQRYEEPVRHSLLAALEREPTFQFQGQLYTTDLQPLQQSTQGQGSVHPIQLQRRPTYRPLACMARYLRTVPRDSWGTFHPSTSTIPGESPSDGYCGPYPAAWLPPLPHGQAFLHAEVASSEVLYREICELFHATVPEDTALVLRVYRIRNDALWEKYSSQKECMSQGRSAREKRLLERHLFHGTTAHNVESICRANFNPRLAGKHGSHYGRGSYFAATADYAHSFTLANHAGQRYMFLAKVLVGTWVQGRPEYTQPPAGEPGGRGYDSCSDAAREPALWVIFNSSQCYPYFVICYKRLGEPVTLDGPGGASLLSWDSAPADWLTQPGFSPLVGLAQGGDE
ncbi:protein mono-ADP-ribosyltransferase TIPARP-like [Carettochelys insculpta]|uniref:protein mono-ADP-ribosyltransferase TIPARP-like n=1 Tax=Carettochelys insculpta TaxID=44489 RepID=UPI003EBEE135